MCHSPRSLGRDFNGVAGSQPGERDALSIVKQGRMYVVGNSDGSDPLQKMLPRASGQDVLNCSWSAWRAVGHVPRRSKERNVGHVSIRAAARRNVHVANGVSRVAKRQQVAIAVLIKAGDRTCDADCVELFCQAMRRGHAHNVCYSFAA